jgi:uncharacterized protein
MTRNRPLRTVPKFYAGEKIDAHAHIGEFGGWANVACDEDDLLSSMRLYNVEKSVLFYWDNNLVRKAVSSHPRKLVGCVWPDPRQKGARGLVRKALTEWGFKGIKLHPLIHAFLPNDDIVHPIMEEARAAKVPVLIHSGHPPFSLPWSIGELAENFKDVTIVMLHMGHGHGIYIKSALEVAKRYDNIYLETSGMPMHSKVKEAVELLGEERVMYGSDIPFHDPSVEIGKICASNLPRRQLERIFYTNAREVLRL